MRGRVLVTLAAVVLIFSLVGNTHAQSLTRVVFNGLTQVQPQGTPPVNVKQMQFSVTVTLNPAGHPPNYIKEITVTVPGGQTFPIDPDKDWSHIDRAYYRTVSEADFTNTGGKIPSGTYRARVVPTSGVAITETDDVQAVFLNVAEITYPTAGTTVTDNTPRFRWNSVTGATFYDVRLWNDSWNEPVHISYVNWFATDHTYADIPKGILKPGLNYRLRIEARSSSTDLDARSRTSWLNFTMGSW